MKKYFYLLLLVLLVSSCTNNKIATERDMLIFSETFVSHYNNLLEKKITNPEYKKYFDFHSNQPYEINSIVSREKGAYLEFSKKSPFQEKSTVGYTDLRIEDFLFPNISLNFTKKINGSEATVFEFTNPLGGSMFLINQTSNILISKIVFYTNQGKFVTLGETGNFMIKNIVVDNVYFENLFIIKGSNLKKSWTKKVAINEATYIFEADLRNAFFKSEDFRKYLASPILHELANVMQDKLETGVYNQPHGALEFEKDLERLTQISKDYNVDVKFANTVLELVQKSREQPSFWEKYNLFIGVVIGTITILIFLFRIIKKKE